MKLETYLDENSISDAVFAADIGVSRSMVTKLRHGMAKPSADTALSIQTVTKGAVMLSDLISTGSKPEPEEVVRAAS